VFDILGLFDAILAGVSSSVKNMNEDFSEK